MRQAVFIAHELSQLPRSEYLIGIYVEGDDHGCSALGVGFVQGLLQDEPMALMEAVEDAESAGCPREDRVRGQGAYLR